MDAASAERGCLDGKGESKHGAHFERKLWRRDVAPQGGCVLSAGVRFLNAGVLTTVLYLVKLVVVHDCQDWANSVWDSSRF